MAGYGNRISREPVRRGIYDALCYGYQYYQVVDHGETRLRLYFQLPDGRIVHGSANIRQSPDSKLWRWVTELLGDVESFEPSELVGIECRVSVDDRGRVEEVFRRG